MPNLKSLIKKITPSFALQRYHSGLSKLGAIYYRNPSDKMIVIGVTGTTGKSTVVNLIAAVLEEAGYKVGLCSTYNFKIAGKEWVNETKQTMQGRFGLQKLLNKMVKAGCQYAVVETSSEGIKQNRHKNINYDAAVFTNLTPEHIESHGSFENYKIAKGKLFQSFGNTKIINGKEVPKISIVNLDDQNSDYFLSFPAQEKWGFCLEDEKARLKILENSENKVSADKTVKAKDILINPTGASFSVNNNQFNIKLLGEFNVKNALAAITVGLSQNIPMEKLTNALAKVKGVPGRMEIIDCGQNFNIIVDYAHEPAGLGQVYKTIANFPHQNIIAVLGSQGGGRDKRKRPILGKLAGEYANYVIVTNEDPYDDDPEEIINEVAEGALAVPGKIINENIWKVPARADGIKKALKLAKKGDVVVITGKGAEQNMVVAGNKKVVWDDRVCVRQNLANISQI